MKLVYIASPYHAGTPDEMERNKQDALNACEEAYQTGRASGERIVPITPLVNFPYLNESDTFEREKALKQGIALLSRCDEMCIAS